MVALCSRGSPRLKVQIIRKRTQNRPLLNERYFSGFGYALSGFRLKRLTAITVKIEMISGTVIPMASIGPIDVAGDVEGTKNFTVTCETEFTRFVPKLVMYHT
jgi:hypothetical protein